MSVNTEQLRQSLKHQWLSYYEENRQWLTRLGVWVNCDGKRRPSSGFILATLSVLEPRLNQLLPLIVDLSSNPDRIVVALGLNFNPDEELETLLQEQTYNNGAIGHRNGTGDNKSDSSLRMLPGTNRVPMSANDTATTLQSKLDESCRGSRDGRE